MKPLQSICAVVVLVMAPRALTSAQNRRGEPPPDVESRDTRLPNGKLQREEILKADHEKSLKEAAELVDLAEQLRADLEKNDRHVLSMNTLKKTEEIEKLAKRIRSRLRRF